MKKKILFVVQDLEIGGAEQLKFTVEKYIDKDKYETSYCCIRSIGTIGEEMIRRGAKIITLGCADNFYNLIATYKLYKLVKKVKPDLMHSMLFNANFHSRVVGILAGVPVIIEEHGLYTWKKWYHILIDRFLARFTGKVIAVSRSVKDFLINQEGLDPDKVIVVYDCVDPNDVNTKSTRKEARKNMLVPDDIFIVGTIGNLREEKGHRILLHALKQVLARHKNVKLFIVGDGPQYQYLVEQAKRIGVAENVVFMMKKTDTSDFLKALDLFVLSSTSEGLGIALLEAIAAGLPCIASDVGGIKEIAGMSAHVSLVRPNNPLGLAAAIIGKIEENKTSGPALKRSGINEVFTPGAYLKNMEAVYNEIFTG